MPHISRPSRKPPGAGCTTVLLLLLLLSGLAVMLYPAIADHVNSRRQSRAIAQYTEAAAQTDENHRAALLARARAYNQSLMGRANRFSPTGEELDAFHSLLGQADAPIGWAEIPAIHVKLPIYASTEPWALQAGLGCMAGSSLPVGGPGTHTVLTGHRALPSSRLLTDLDRVVQGDRFTLCVQQETMTYEVEEILIVEPWDFSPLAIQPDRDLCTLLTCTPYGVNTHRILVRGHRVEAGPPPVPEPLQPSWQGPAIAILLAICFLLLLPVLVRRRRRCAGGPPRENRPHTGNPSSD